jgi:diguanylate cyclase (GGDEF)-like protein
MDNKPNDLEAKRAQRDTEEREAGGADPTDTIDLGEFIERDPELLERAVEAAARTAALRAHVEIASAAGELSVRAEVAGIEQIDRLLAAYDRAAAAVDRYRATVLRHRAEEYLRNAYRDELTGAMQRDVGLSRLVAEISHCERSGASLSVIFVDVDGLKNINDTRGHDAGDQVLRDVGNTLARSLRSYDLVIRYGGDEFVVALPDAVVEQAEARLGPIVDMLRRTNRDASVTAGLSQLQQGDTLDEVLRRADQDMYARRATRGIPQPKQPSD